MQSIVEKAIAEANVAHQMLQKNTRLLAILTEAGTLLGERLAAGYKAYSCGNGGSMCDAMHFAEELTGRFRNERRPLAAVAISDPAYLSCTANDYGYEQVFSRFIEGFGQKGDILVAISTSGKSPNILRAVQMARDKGMTVIALTGHEACPIGDLAHFHLATESGTAFSDRVQELHILCIHILIQLAEKAAKL